MENGINLYKTTFKETNKKGKLYLIQVKNLSPSKQKKVK